MKFSWTFSFALIPCLACGREPTRPGLRANLTSDRTSYIATSSGTGAASNYIFTVIARYANESDVTIYLPKCTASDLHPIVGVEAVAGDVEPPPSALPGACTGTAPFSIAPGEVRTDTLSLVVPGAPAVGNGVYAGPPQIRAEFFYIASTCSDGGTCPVPFEARTSNVVTIQMPQQ